MHVFIGVSHNSPAAFFLLLPQQTSVNVSVLLVVTMAVYPFSLSQ